MTAPKNTVHIELDALVIGRTWDAGAKRFFAGLEEYVETGRAA